MAQQFPVPFLPIRFLLFLHPYTFVILVVVLILIISQDDVPMTLYVSMCVHVCPCVSMCICVSIQGRRPYQEDRFDLRGDGDTLSLFGVFDGHGGHKASEYCKNNLLAMILNHEDLDTDLNHALM